MPKPKQSHPPPSYHTIKPLPINPQNKHPRLPSQHFSYHGNLPRPTQELTSGRHHNTKIKNNKNNTLIHLHPINSIEKNCFPRYLIWLYSKYQQHNKSIMIMPKCWQHTHPLWSTISTMIQHWISTTWLIYYDNAQMLASLVGSNMNTQYPLWSLPALIYNRICTMFSTILMILLQHQYIYNWATHYITQTTLHSIYVLC